MADVDGLTLRHIQVKDVLIWDGFASSESSSLIHFVKKQSEGALGSFSVKKLPLHNLTQRQPRPFSPDRFRCRLINGKQKYRPPSGLHQWKQSEGQKLSVSA